MEEALLRTFPRRFFEQPTLEVARALLGAHLVRSWGKGRLSGRIVEVEAYIGEEDSACHASRGRTRRNSVMFGPAGHAYVYFTYGMHWMLNVVTEVEGSPAAVLVRAIEPVEGLEQMRTLRGGRSDRLLTSGPARLCAALRIDGAHNGADLLDPSAPLWLEPGLPPPRSAIRATARIGIDYARPADRIRPWRLLDARSLHLSRPLPPGLARPGR